MLWPNSQANENEVLLEENESLQNSDNKEK